MGTLLFVHGTGVRQQGYDETLENIKKGLAGVNRTDLAVEGIPWGILLGTHVDDKQIRDMLPPTGAKGLGETDEEIEANLWANLLIDPLFELRLASLKQSGGPVIAAPGQMLTSEAIKTKLRAINFGGLTPSGGLSMQQIKAAAAWLADGDGAGVLTDAAAAISDPNDPALVGAVARAVVAYALEQARGEIGTGPNALYIVSERNALVEQVARELSGGVKGLGDWLLSLARKFAEAWGTAYGKDRRSGLMTSV